jgi:hypothetical protein
MDFNQTRLNQFHLFKAGETKTPTGCHPEKKTPNVAHRLLQGTNSATSLCTL